MYIRTFIYLSKSNTLTFCILNSRRIDFFEQRYSEDNLAMYFYLHFNLFITRFTSANLLYVSDMLWRMWKGAQRCLRRVVTVEPFYLIQTLSAVACSICPWNRFTVVIQSFHLCETIVSRRWKDLFTNMKWSDRVVPGHTIPWWNIHSRKLSPRFIGWSGI